MTDVTRIINSIEAGDASAAQQLLPLVYDELRKLATSRLAREKPGHTLLPTALVHEAYLRLIGNDEQKVWQGRSHFFAAAAEAMRRILIESARHKRTQKAGGGRPRRTISESDIWEQDNRIDLLALDEALDRLQQQDSQAAELVKLRYFAGFTSEQASDLLSISSRTADRIWVYAKSFLHNELYPE